MLRTTRDLSDVFCEDKDRASVFCSTKIGQEEDVCSLVSLYFVLPLYFLQYRSPAMISIPPQRPAMHK